MEDQNILLVLGEIKSRLSVIEEKVTRLDKTISGNGKPGLCDDFRFLETKVNNHLSDAEKVSERKEKIGGRQWAVWLLIISNVVALGFQLVRTGFIK